MMKDAWEWLDFEEVGSTNDEVLKYMEKGKKVVLTAVCQSKGRGRRGRHWVSQNGNLFMSMAMPLELKDSGAMVFLLSLALCESIKKLKATAKVELKWPNDVLLDNKKVSGILLERSGEFIVMGVGVNIVDFPKSSDVLYPLTSLSQAGIETQRVQLLEIYLKEFDELFALWQKHGQSAIISKWLKCAKGIGSNIRVNMPSSSICGVFTGLDEEGVLLLQTSEGMKKVSAGDVFFEEE